ncbi:SGNH/GDSL hydrolase family protein [Candidatus Omnitrophota bacterium]
MAKRIVFTFIILVIVAVVLEGVSWIIARTRLVQQAPSYQSTMMNDPILHHIWVPSLKKIDKSRSTPYTLITNRQSWVEKHDVVKEKPSSVFRIFYVGDSTTQGVVDSEYKMVEIVERELNKRYVDQNITFEVINTGTSSYSFIPYYLLIKTKLLEYAPDLIFINVDMTDVVNDAAYRRLMVIDDDGEITAIPAEISQRYILTPDGYAKVDVSFTLPQGLVRHSDFFYLIDLAIRKISLKNTEPVIQREANWLQTTWTSTIQGNINESMMVLVSIFKILKLHHIDVCVTGVPHFPQYIGTWSPTPHEMLESVCKKAGVKYLNSFRELWQKIATSGLSRYYWATDGTHFNRDGNAIWAEAQLAFLLDPDNQLLPFIAHSKAEVIEQLGRSASFWNEISNKQTKKRAVAYSINRYKQQGAMIRKPVARYVFLLDSLSVEKPELLLTPFDNLLKALAVMEADFNEG